MGFKLNDTIAAIATPRGSGGIAIIRISGKDAKKIAANMVFPCGGGEIYNMEDRKLTLCRIVDSCEENGGYLIDRALVAVMEAPKTYTGEEVVEINCHGGYLVADKVLDSLLKCGARLAEAGEFTRRAFINGKTDLSGAEAVMDLMNASTDAGLHNAAMSLTGKLEQKIKDIRQDVLELASHVSAVADYPEEVDPLDDTEVTEKLEEIHKRLKSMADGFDTGRVMRDGVRTAIVGKPNVGKSSILNALLKFERAIVTDIPGTTRDTIEEVINIGGIALRLIDTAGIRNAADEVEKIGIEKSEENIKEADLVLFVVDSSEELSQEDFRIAENVKDKKCILICNKTDKNKLSLKDEDIEKFAELLKITPDGITATSAPTGAEPMGIDVLEKKISDMFAYGAVRTDEVYLANERQKDAVIRADISVLKAKDGIETGMPYDLMFVDLEDAMSALGEITGETVQEEIIDSVFERFCVGK